MEKSNEVYKITNLVTNKVYIGITNQGSGVRYQKHWSDARHGDPCPIHLSMAKYGEENFKLEVIDFAKTYDELKEKEKYWIKQCDSKNREKGYNLTDGGDGTFGRMHSEETKEKIRQKAIGRKASEETKKRMSLSQQKHKELHQKNADHARMFNYRPVIALDLDGNTLKEFVTTKECAKEYRVSSTMIKTYCRSIEPKVAKKFNIIWRYKDAA